MEINNAKLDAFTQSIFAVPAFAFEWQLSTDNGEDIIEVSVCDPVCKGLPLQMLRAASFATFYMDIDEFGELIKTNNS